MKKFWKKSIITSTVAVITTSVVAFANAAIPIRTAFEELGADVSWYAPEQRITITIADYDDEFVFFVSQTRAIINGSEFTLPDPVSNASGTSIITENSLQAVVDFLLEYEEEVYLGPRPTGFIHRIEHEGRVAYLFGTLHAGPSEMFPLADVVYDAMYRSTIFATEIDLLAENYSPEEVERLMNSIFIRDGQTIYDILTPEAYERYVYALSTFGMQYSQFYRISPTIMQMEVTRTVMAEVDNVDFAAATSSVDVYVVNHALRRGLPTIGLVTNAVQMENISHAPNEILNLTAGSFPTLEELTLELENSQIIDLISLPYILNDRDSLNAANLVEDYGDYKILMTHQAEVFLNMRSLEFAESILSIMEEMDEEDVLFVAVGVSHVVRAGLLGGIELRNIVDFLTEKGVSVTPIYEEVYEDYEDYENIY